jgi:DMSO/TMAO reductase YedYZ molybdopterin-dependent catalytic subunit
VKTESRRDFLNRGVLGCTGFLAVPRAWNQATKPEVSSFDLSLLDEWLTPNSLFFVRDHFPAPSTSSDKHKLSVVGAVGSPLEIPYADLLREPRTTLAVTLECAENPPGGGLVGHAEWGGIAVAGLLAKAQPQPGAGYVRMRGADGYSRTIPMMKALRPDTLLALTMNGDRLPAAHGFPIRAVVPGWYGMDSVKWLDTIEVLREEDAGGTQAYRRVQSLVGFKQDAGPVSAMEVKSVFSRPVDGAILMGRRFTVRGAAWAGEKPVKTVEVSVDGGSSWQTARFSSGQPSPQPYAWVHWEYNWEIPGPGSYELACRATDESGRVQPAKRAADRVDDYELNAWHRVKVTAV